MKRVILINDTSGGHCGSVLTMEIIEYCLGRKAKILYRCRATKKELNLDFNKCDILLINGEGTLHDYPPNARVKVIHNAIAAALDNEVKVAIINATIENVGQIDFTKISFVGARDRHTAIYMRDIGCVNVFEGYDACFTIPKSKDDSRKRKGILVTDSVVQSFSKDLSKLAEDKKYIYRPFDNKTNYMDMIKVFRKASMVITGRYHGFVFAALTGTPCIAVTSNTKKIEYLADMFNANHMTYSTVDSLAKDIEKVMEDPNKYILNYPEETQDSLRHQINEALGDI